jgi:hypothetical protein
MAAAPLPARTLLAEVAGTAAPDVEARWSLLSDSPVVTSLVFINWDVPAAPARPSAARSHLLAALLVATRLPTAAALVAYKAQPFLTHEADHGQASPILHQLDIVAAFSAVYRTWEEWIAAIPGIWAKLADPALVRLPVGFFVEREGYAARAAAPPPEIAFLLSTSIGALSEADALSSPDPSHLTLARAFLLAGSKDSRAVRDDEASAFRISTERVRAIVESRLNTRSPSNPGLARKYVDTLCELHLQDAFTSTTVTAMHAIAELEAAFKFETGTDAEKDGVLRPRILRVGLHYKHLKAVIDRFTDPSLAWHELNRLVINFLPTAIAGADILIKLSQLNAFLNAAAWRALITQSINSNPAISGPELTAALIASQRDFTGGSAGGAGNGVFSAAAAPNSGPASGQSYGGVREASLADALRMKTARDALAKVRDDKLTGVERVEAFMTSSSTILMRAMLLQESWLLNKSAELSCCSLDEPYICPYIAETLCEDEGTGKVSSRLEAFTFSTARLALVRNPRWSLIPLIDIALEIEALRTGAVFLPVNALDTYTVAAALEKVRAVGKPFFFSLGIALDPSSGKSFSDGVDKQLEAVAFASTLPTDERREWMTFLDHEFRTNFLDRGGELYFSKLKSARPELAEADIDCFVPSDNAYFRNVNARMKRAEPIADLRVAFPSLLKSAPVSLPGTSAATPASPSPPGGGGGGVGDGGGGKGGGPKKKFPPGSKAKMAGELSADEFFHTGTVFNTKEITAKYKLPGDVCLAVLLSKKKGTEALQLCPDPKTHGDMAADCHKRPKAFDLEHIYKHHARRATAAECKTFGWTAFKKQKN